MESRRRSLVKALSWRLIALTVTTGLGYLFTSSVVFAASIGLADSAIKIFAYYMHERAWNNVDVGRQLPAGRRSEPDSNESSTRLLAG